MSEQEFENYLALLGGLLKLQKAQRDAIGQELRDHLEDRLEILTQNGVSRADAITMALEEFGDLSQLAAQLSASARHQRRRWIMRLSFATGSAAALLVLAVMAIWPSAEHGVTPQNAHAQAGGDPAPQPNGAQPTGDPALPLRRPKTANILVATERDTATLQTEEKMRGKVAIDLQETPLSEMASYIAQQLDVQVLIDEAGLTEAGIDSATTNVTLTLRDIPADAALDFALSPLALGYHVKSGIVTITTQERLDKELSVRLYPVHKLLYGSDRIGPLLEGHAMQSLVAWMKEHYPCLNEENIDLKAFEEKCQQDLARAMQSSQQIQTRSRNLKALIQQTVAKNSWTNDEGLGTIEIYRGTLIVVQTDAIHRQIATLLAHFQELEESADVSFWEADFINKDGEATGGGGFGAGLGGGGFGGGGGGFGGGGGGFGGGGFF